MSLRRSTVAAAVARRVLHRDAARAAAACGRATPLALRRCTSGSGAAAGLPCPPSPAASLGAVRFAGSLPSEQQQPPYDRAAHVAEAEALLREVFGPQAKLVVRTVAQPQHRQRRAQAGAAAAAAAEEGDGDAAVVDDDGDDDGDGADSSSGQLHADRGEKELSQYFRASATFRLLGFPVELAATKGRDAAATVENCLRQALSSDVEFIRPAPNASRRRPASGSARDARNNRRHQQQQHHSSSSVAGGGGGGGGALGGLKPHQQELKAITDELRQMCAAMSRSVRFSVKPPLAAISRGGAGGGSASGQWRCRAYMKDEWAAVARMGLCCEETGASPNDALTRCVAAVRGRLREEASSPAAVLEPVQELRALLAPLGRRVTAECHAEGAARPPQAGAAGPPTHAATVTVADAHGNVARSVVRRQPSEAAAYKAAAAHRMRALLETPSPDTTAEGAALLLRRQPLLSRMRWQFDRMVDIIARTTGQRGVAAVTVGGVGAEGGVPVFFTAEVRVEGAVVWQSTGAGRYRVEFDSYVQALYHLIDQFPEVAALAASERHGTFPTAAALSAAADAHDGFDVLTAHRGNWTCYALLGTLSSQLIGSYFQTTYRYVPPPPTAATAASTTTTMTGATSPLTVVDGDGDAAADARGEWCATLTVSDGCGSDSVPLIERGAVTRGEAWRRAVLDALRENFPRQYAAAVRRHPDIDLSSDTMARGAKYRALPREKRVEHIGNLLSLVAAFAEEDLGWHQLRVRLRNASGDLGLPQWVAEMEALVDAAAGEGDGEGEDGGGGQQRRVVAVSEPYTQARHAKRAIIFRVAQRYFPKELAVYQALDRGDALDPDADPSARRTRLYLPGGPSFASQLCALLEAKHPSLAPITWQLWARGAAAAPPATDDGDGDDAASTWMDGAAVLDDGDGDDGASSTRLRLLLNPELFPEYQLPALRTQLAYEARVVGEHGDVLIAENRGGPGDGAVAVLAEALRAASRHLAGADGETLWTEFETHPCPAVTTSRELALHLFQSFLGGTAAAASEEDGSAIVSGGGDAAVAVTAAQIVNDYWFSTVTLPRLGHLPVARAVGSTKRGSARDALTLAARTNFPRLLQYLQRRDPGVSSLAADLLTEPVVEQLPDAAAREVRRVLAASRRRASASAVMPPMRLLMRCMREQQQQQQQQQHSGAAEAATTVLDPVTGDAVGVAPKRLVVLQAQADGGSTHTCRIHLQSHRRAVRRGDTQLVGFGSGMSPTQAADAAARMALENLFPEVAAEVSAAAAGEARGPA